MRVWLMILVLLSFAVSSNAVNASATAPVTRTFYYATPHDDQHEVIATWVPGATNRPWIITIHGGSWSYQNPEGMQKQMSLFTRAGYNVFNVGYPLLSTPGTTYRDTLGGVRSAFRFVKQHHGYFGDNPTRGAVYGFSAGGNLALQLGLAGDGNTGIKAIVTAAAVSQPMRVDADALGLRPTTEPPTDQMRALAKVTESITKCPVTDHSSTCTQAWHAISPEFLISPHDPAVLTFQGTLDATVPYQSGAAFHYWLRKQDVWAKSVDVPGLGHTTKVAFDNGSRQAYMLQFLAQHTK